MFQQKIAQHLTNSKPETAPLFQSSTIRETPSITIFLSTDTIFYLFSPLQPAPPHQKKWQMDMKQCPRKLF